MAFDCFETNVFRWNMRGNSTLHIAFFGDLHGDCKMSDAKAQLKELKARTDKLPRESVLFVGMGDYDDFLSSSERKKIAAAELHESTMDSLNGVAEKHMRETAKVMEFMRGRIIGLHCGNHDYRHPNGEYSSEHLARLMGCRHIGYTGYTRILLTGFVKGGGSRSSVDVFSSHGKGSGRLLGSPFNTVAQMAQIFPMADIFAQGHDHARGGLPATTLYMEYNAAGDSLDVREKTQVFVRSGSSLRGYAPKSNSYIAKALYKPCALGFPIASVEFKRMIVDGKDVIRKSVHCWS